MAAQMSGATLASRLIDGLYTEAMLLADETRGYFEGEGVAEREALPPRERVDFACEALKGTTRLMHVIAWLLVRRAISEGELEPGDAAAPQRRLGETPPLDLDALAGLPEPARRLLSQGADLYERVRRLDEGSIVPTAIASPALSLIQRLERSF